MCPTGKYSLKIGDDKCFPCPENANCSKNGSYIDVNFGYWRYNYYSTLIYKCFNHYSCIGSNECEIGYEGPLCDSCVMNNKLNYYKGNDLNCYKCKDVTLSYIFLAIIIFAITVYILYSVNHTMKIFDSIRNHKINKKKDNPITDILIKILADYINNLACIFSFKTNIKFNVEINLAIISNFNSLFNLLNPFDCVLFQINYKNISFYYQKMIIGSFIVCVIPFILLIYWNIKGLFFNIESKIKKRKIAISICIFCYIFQPSILNSYFKYQNCIVLEGNTLLLHQLTEKCWENDHFFYFMTLFFPILIIWMLVLPGFLLQLMFRNKNKKYIHIVNKNEIELNIYQFFKIGYKTKYYYWEFVHLIRKYCLIFLSIFQISINMLFNIIIIIFILFLFAILQIIASPYKNSRLNNISIFYNFSLYSTSILFFLIMINSENLISVFYVILICLINLAFCIYLFFNFCKDHKTKIENFVYKVKDSIKKLNKAHKNRKKINFINET